MTNHRESKANEDKNKNAIAQLQDFANDSVNFFNKCAKPNRSGKNFGFVKADS